MGSYSYLAGLLVMSIGLMTYFHGDTKSDMQELESRMDKRFDKLEKPYYTKKITTLYKI